MRKQSVVAKTLKRIPSYYRHLSGGVAIAMLGLSLKHQAYGVQSTTGVDSMEAWLMAIGIDVAMVAAEVSMLAGVRTAWTKAILVATLILSACFNVLGFWQAGAAGYSNAVAVVLGVLIPMIIYGSLHTLNHKHVRYVARTAKATKRTNGKVVAIR
jgi:hypothetical protein